MVNTARVVSISSPLLVLFALATPSFANQDNQGNQANQVNQGTVDAAAKDQEGVAAIASLSSTSAWVIVTRTDRPGEGASVFFGEGSAREESRSADSATRLSVFAPRVRSPEGSRPAARSHLDSSEHAASRSRSSDSYTNARPARGDFTALSTPPSAPKTVHVRGYYRRDGTYVRPHWRSPPRARSGSRR